MTDNLKTFALLLAGGTGTRLWPVSRERFPKQLVRFIGKDSLVQSTLKRLSPALDPEEAVIVCGEEHYHEIRRHISDIGFSPEGKVICEPCGRNTAPAILLGVLSLLKDREDAVVFVFPADHVIGDKKMFHEKIGAAHRLADEGYIVTFGIQPHYPETGYGYIEGGESVSQGARTIQRFVEKPDRRTAESYLAKGNFFWNSGMFAFRASVAMDEYRRTCPEMVEMMEQMIKMDTLTPEGYQALPDISIDYAVMEQTDKGVVLPSDFGWSDIGSWKSLYDFLPKDADKNVIDGDVITKGTENCFILGNERLIATNHIKNMVIVETPDSVFVSDLDTSRDVKQIVTELKISGREEFKTHRTAYHPWGTLTELANEPDSKIQRVTIYPEKVCEFDVLEKMKNFFTVVTGSGIMTTGGREKTIGAGDTFQIPAREAVGIANPGTDVLVCIQISLK